MKVIHVVGSISDASSGPSQSVPALCRALGAAGVDVELHHVDYGTRPEPPGVRTVAHTRTRLPGLRAAGWSTELLRALLHEARPGTIFHAHGLWIFQAIYPGLVGALRQVPCVCSPRGTLSPWALERSPWRKRVSLLLGQRFALDHASLFHATSESEAEDIRHFGLQAPTIVVPNVLEAPSLEPTPWSKRSGVLFLSRLHPVKGLDQLLTSWGQLHSRFGDEELLVAGPSELGYGERMQSLARDLQLPRVRFLGPVEGHAKWELLGRVRALALPSRSENFGMVVAEALSMGTPVLTTRGTPWKALEDEAMGWWVDPSTEGVSSGLGALASTGTAVLEAMGQRGRAWVASHLSGPAVARSLLPHYEALAGSAPRG